MSTICQTKIPVALEWTIEKYQLNDLRVPGENKIKIQSEKFNASRNPDISYSISIHSYGNEETRRGQTWIYFLLDFNNGIKIEANFNIVIESANFSYFSKHIFEKSKARGAYCCITNKLFDPKKGFIVDGELTVKMDGFLMVEKEVQQKIDKFGDHRDAVCLGLWEQDNKDFAIVADGKEITAHKWILALRSPVFAKMINSGLKETQENRVEIGDFSFDIVEKAIKLCYHPSLVGATTLEDKMQLLQFYDKYDMQSFKNDLQDCLISKCDVTNVCRLTNAALISNALKLKTKCSKFLHGCLRSQPISDFDLLDKDFALNLLKSAFCCVSE